jgi:hypothetical protein
LITELELTADRDRTHPGRGKRVLAAVEDSLLGRAALLFESSVVSVLQQLGDLPLDVGRVLGGGLLEYRLRRMKKYKC